jgi:hypothetical protein
MRGLLLFETLAADLRFGARIFKRNSGFAAVAVLTLAVGIGPNSHLQPWGAGRDSVVPAALALVPESRSQ